MLGRAVGILMMSGLREDFMHADVVVFGAPSECHALVSRGQERRLRQARRHAKAESGLTNWQFRQLIHKIPRSHWQKWENRLYSQHFPF